MRQMMMAQAIPKVIPRKKDTTPALAPSGVSWSSPGPTSLVLSWKPGTDPDSAVIRHEYCINNGPALQADSPTGTTITGLTRRTSYVIGVRAVSAGGPSPWVSITATTVYAAMLPNFKPPLDDAHADMRPQTGITWQATVGPDKDDDYKSVAAAAKAAKEADPNRTMMTRAIIWVKDGIYVSDVVELDNWVAVVGLSGDPTKVIIQNVTSYAIMQNGGRGAIDTWGATFVEAVTCKRVDTDAPAGVETNPKYAVHGTSGACSIWVNCIFDTGQSTNALGLPSIFGQDGGDGNYTLFYSCLFIGCRNDSDTNVHAGGGDGDPSHPEQVAYVGCTWQTTHLADIGTYHTLVGAFGFKPLNDNRKNDALWIVGCKGITAALMEGGAGGIVHKPADLPMTQKSNPGTIDTRQDWPKPVDWRLAA